MAKAKEIKIKIITDENTNKESPFIKAEKPKEIKESSSQFISWTIKNSTNRFQKTDIYLIIILLAAVFYALTQKDYILLALAITFIFALLLVNFIAKKNTLVELTEEGLTVDSLHYSWLEFEKYEIREMNNEKWLILEFKNKPNFPLWLKLDGNLKIDNIKKLIAEKTPEGQINSLKSSWLESILK